MQSFSLPIETDDCSLPPSDDLHTHTYTHTRQCVLCETVFTPTEWLYKLCSTQYSLHQLECTFHHCTIFTHRSHCTTVLTVLLTRCTHWTHCSHCRRSTIVQRKDFPLHCRFHDDQISAGCASLLDVHHEFPRSTGCGFRFLDPPPPFVPSADKKKPRRL